MVTIAEPNDTIEKTPVNKSVVWPCGAVMARTVLRKRQNMSGPHKSQSLKACSVSDFGSTTIRTFDLISERSFCWS